MQEVASATRVEVQTDPELEAIRAKLRAQLAPATSPTTPARPIDVGDADFVEFVKEHPLVLIDVWAPWCGPCRIVGPIVDDLAREMAGTLTVGKVNADDNPGVMQAFGIQGIPTLLLFRDGRLVDRLVGAAPKPQLAALVQRHVRR